MIPLTTIFWCTNSKIVTHTVPQVLILSVIHAKTAHTLTKDSSTSPKDICPLKTAATYEY